MSDGFLGTSHFCWVPIIYSSQIGFRIFFGTPHLNPLLEKGEAD
jgi:hypothetical protein